MEVERIEFKRVCGVCATSWGHHVSSASSSADVADSGNYFKNCLKLVVGSTEVNQVKLYIESFIVV